MKKILDGKEVEMTEFEIQQLQQSRIKTWSKEEHIAEINFLHEEVFNKKLTDAEYVGRWELNAVLSDPDNEYYQEAKDIIAYWWDCWDVIKSYGETVTEQNMIDPQTFVNNLEVV